MKTATKEKPIIFTADSVRAILEGRKTQTRRVLKPQPDFDGKWWNYRNYYVGNETSFCKNVVEFAGSPYRVGDRLWVRETWLHEDGWYPDADWKNTFVEGKGFTTVNYRASSTHEELQEIAELGCRWRSPIHMPRWASRIDLEVTGVRCERLQAMTFKDWIADFSPSHRDQEKALATFKGQDNQKQMASEYWDTINGRKHPWASNPWVWGIEFKRVKP